MNYWKKPLLVNTLIILGLFGITFLFQSPNIGLSERIAFTSIFMMVMAPLNLVLGMVRNRNKKPDGQIFIMIAGLLLLVGFSVCTGTFYVNTKS